MATHDLKLDVTYWDAVTTGLKTFEVRMNDRDYHVGDVLRLHAWEAGSYAFVPTPVAAFKVTYIHEGLGMAPGYVVLGIVRWKEAPSE